MSVTIVPAAHQLILREDASELQPGDAVTFTINEWQKGEREIAAEVVAETAPGRFKVRVGSGPSAAHFNVPAAACTLVLPAAHRRAA